MRDHIAIWSVVVLWGLNYVFIKMGVAEFPPLFMTALRFVGIAGIMIWFAKMPRGQWKELFIISFLFGVTHFGFMFMAVSQIDASVASIINPLGVPFSVLLAVVFLKETVGWRTSLGIGIAFIGVVVTAGEPTSASSIPYMALATVSMFSWAAGNILVSKLKGIDAFSLTAWTAVLSIPQMFLISALLETGQIEAFYSASTRAWIGLGYATIAASVVGYVLWYYMLEHHPVNKVVAYTLVMPVIGVGSGVLMLGEDLTPEKTIGCALVMFGVGIIHWRKRRKAKPAT